LSIRSNSGEPGSADIIIQVYLWRKVPAARLLSQVYLWRKVPAVIKLIN
jgi:hypothetical protein